ncbi:MAG: hypothetical protein AAGK05_11185 [Pseudomonadota bacterium]
MSEEHSGWPSKRASVGLNVIKGGASPIDVALKLLKDVKETAIADNDKQGSQSETMHWRVTARDFIRVANEVF